MLSPHGLLLDYDHDRAALDLGLHLYEPSAPGPNSEVGQVRVWFQLKGVQAQTLGAEELRDAQEVPVSGLSIEHILYWFAHPEPVYLALYIEALDRFLAQDVRDLVDCNGGFPRLKEISASQESMTLRMPISATLEGALSQMPRHRSLRLDGPDFRGRPLGHRMDPLRSELAPLAPADFEAMVQCLLRAHDFRPADQIEIDSMLEPPIGTVKAEVGRLYLTYEWTTPLETEFGVGPDNDLRMEARPHSAHGDVLVIVHADVANAPHATAATKQLVEELQLQEIERALVFFNASDRDAGLLGGWRTTLEPLVRVPQGLGSLAFNVLTATSVYLEFLDRLDWRIANFR